MLISLYLIFECAFNLWCKIFFSIASAVRSLTVFSAIWQPSGKEVSGRIHSSPLYTFKNWMCSPCIHAVAQFKVLLSIQKKRETAALRQFLSFMLQRGLGLRAPASCRHPPTRLRSYIRIPADVRSRYSRRRSVSSPLVYTKKERNSRFAAISLFYAAERT